MIIIEGLDATGKSTLAKQIQDQIGWPIQPSQGPEKYPGEIIKRSEQYLQLPDHTIFDRHPLISQFIYGHLSNKTLPPMYLLQQLKARRPFIIEAHHSNMGEHQLKDHDTPEHLKLIEQREKLSHLYDQFFLAHFPERVIYTFETMEDTANIAAAYVRRQENE